MLKAMTIKAAIVAPSAQRRHVNGDRWPVVND
jgi:hypothetical protein